MMQLSTAMGNGKDTRPVSCTQSNHQEVTDDAENKNEGRKHLKWNNEAMKNFTAEKTLDEWGIAEDVNDSILFICLQKGRKLKDNSCYTIGCIEVLRGSFGFQLLRQSELTMKVFRAILL